jgi:HAD superfamily hydrolase (TIGR01509 family)
VTGRPGVLFDVDGTLVDTTYLHAVCWWQAFGQVGTDVSMARIHRAIGMGSDHLLDHLLGEDRDRDADAGLESAHAALHATYWTRLRPTAGARSLLQACADRGLAVVLASSASGDELGALRHAIGADDLIDAVTTADDVSSSKPSAQMIDVALERGGVDRDQAVFVGDSVWDVLAARKAGIPCIGLECGGTSAAELTEAGARGVYADPAELVDKLADSEITRSAG